MVIRNGVIFTEDAGFRKGDLFVKDGKFNKIIFQDLRYLYQPFDINTLTVENII